jgi:hypothetical protein
VEEGGGWRLVMLVRILFWTSMWRGMADLGCILELTVLSILLLNVAQSTYALRYPRTSVPLPPPPPPTPGAKTNFNKALLTPVNNSAKVKRKLSPNVRPSLPPSFLLSVPPYA